MPARFVDTGLAGKQISAGIFIAPGKIRE